MEGRKGDILVSAARMPYNLESSGVVNQNTLSTLMIISFPPRIINLRAQFVTLLAMISSHLPKADTKCDTYHLPVVHYVSKLIKFRAQEFKS